MSENVAKVEEVAPLQQEAKPSNEEKAPEVKEEGASKEEASILTDEAKSTENNEQKEKTEASEEKGKVEESIELKIPEGSQLDPKHVVTVVEFAKAHGLSSAQAQAILDRDSAAVSDFYKAQEAHVETITKAWAEEAKNDKELGGDAFGKNAELARRVVSRFGSEALKETLRKTGLGNHPELLRVFTRIGREMAEDQLVLPGSQLPEREKSAAEILYGSMNQ